MSKDIIIQEKGVEKTFAGTKKVNTNLFGESSASWIPEDETELTSLEVTENGEYTPSGYYGFSEVKVNVNEHPEPVLGEIEISENGVYIANSYDLDAFSKVSVSVPAGSILGIYFKQKPQLEYFAGETVDLSDAIICARYRDGTEKDVTEECVFAPSDGSVVPQGIESFNIMAIWESDE